MMQRDSFVAREPELSRLKAALDRAISGEGQICFVVGEAGSGKTTLIREFARLSQERHEDLVVATGQCDAQSGVGDAYLPFREILDLLTGDVDAKLARGSITSENAGRLRKLLRVSGETLIEVAPDLIGMFVPWAGLIMRLGALAAEKGSIAEKLKRRGKQQVARETPASQTIDQGQIFQQYINLLGALALKQPLMLVLDDLQWADSSSIGLLFRLGRRLGSSRILVVGTYRPEEVAVGRAGERHPLEKPLAEFKRYYGDIWIDLDQASQSGGRRFVDLLLDAEPNRLDEGFRQALCEHTSGHALFTVELLRAMQERGDLVINDDGLWAEGSSLDWITLPARVEGIIEERLGRLTEDLREILRLASVEGERFTAEVIARVRELEARHLVRRLSNELEKQHRLIAAQGSQRVGPHRVSHYRFIHNLFQDYLYSTLDEVERTYLHEDVAYALEELYGDHAADIAVHMARHFVAADIRDKARYYLQRAGEHAAARFANEEAVKHLSLALSLSPEEELDDRYELLRIRERVYDVQGERAAQVRDLAALESLAEALNDDSRRTEAALRRAHFAEATSDYLTAIAAAMTAVNLARVAQDAREESKGHLQWGRVLWHQGEYAAARSQLEGALTLARLHQLRSVEADCLSNLGIVSWYQGDYAAGKLLFEQALAVRQELEDRQGEAHVLNNLAGVAYEQGNHAEAVTRQDQALQIYRRSGDRRGEGMALCNLGAFLLEQGSYSQAGTYLESSLSTYLDIEDREGEIATLINLGILSLYQGDYGQARDHLERSLQISGRTGDRRGEVEALVYLSLLHHQRDDDELAYKIADKALAVAREVGDRRNQSHALTHLGHALAGLHRPDEASTAYEEALAVRLETGEHHRAMENLAGLARVSLAQGKSVAALSRVEEILAFMEVDTLEGTDEPVRVYLTCYRVLQAQRDARAPGLLAAAFSLLQERAAHIGDPATRRLFLDSIRAHRQVMRESE